MSNYMYEINNIEDYLINKSLLQKLCIVKYRFKYWLMIDKNNQELRGVINFVIL